MWKLYFVQKCLVKNQIKSSSLGQVFATSFAAFDRFQNTQTLRSSVFQAVSMNFILQLFYYFFRFYVQLFVATLLNFCAKCKSENLI